MRLLPLWSVCLSAAVLAAEPNARTQNFDADPNWEGVNNRLTREHYPTIIQNFGYSSDTNVAGREKGEIGGAITRSNTPAYYAMKVDPVTLEKPLSASG